MTKKDFDNHRLICKGKSPNIAFEKNEFLNIQNRIKVLDSTLKKCVFDMDKISSIFLKGKTKRKLTSSQAHTQHASHAHYTHAYMYDKVYTCTHCGRKGHLAIFFYFRLNMKVKNV